MQKILSLPLLSIVASLTIVTVINKLFPDHTNYKSPTLYLFSHGLANTYRQVYNYVETYNVDGQIYVNDRSILGSPFYSFNYPDATTGFWRVNFWQTSLGQDNEIEALNNAYQNVLLQYRQNQSTPDNNDYQHQDNFQSQCTAHNQQSAHTQHSAHTQLIAFNSLNTNNQDTSYMTQPVKAHCTQHINPQIVICGVSRGASIIVNFLALHNPEHVKAVILESPFDHGESIAQNLLEQLNIESTGRLQHAMHNLLTMVFKKYRINGAQPIEIAPRIKNKEIPILIICSKQDQRVPWFSSKKLYDILKQLGYSKTHILIVDNGAHDKIFLEADGDLYQQVVHAFYAKYGLIYDNEKAFYGKNIFAQCQP